jgi:hypothetical protein
MSTRELQARMGAALRHADHEAVAATALQGDAAPVMRRLAIYRGNVVASVTRALRAHYPVCAAFVGDAFFDALARAYWCEHPSQSGDLGLYGAALADFLEHFTPVRDNLQLACLPDLARLEWAVHVAGSAADAPPEPITREPALLWMPGTQVLAAQHPVADLWQAHQPLLAGESVADLEQVTWQPQGALVHRAGLQVNVARLPFDQALALIELIRCDPNRPDPISTHPGTEPEANPT